MQESGVRIFLDTIEVPLKLGLFAHEKNAPQRVIVTVEVYADTASYLRNATPQSIIDYNVIYQTISSWADRPHTQLIEDYLRELLTLCFDFPAVTVCRASIQKADVFGPEQGAGIEACIRREEWA
ncbi:MAG: dihydroneopterin aldolase [Alphaproteobacteria bacterium]|nr:dihydroneopterin aldolase [Alphaproteobacteria bacterium]